MLTIQDLAHFLATSNAHRSMRKSALATPLLAGLAGAGVGGLGAGGTELLSTDKKKRRKARTRALTGAAAGGLLGAAGGALYDTSAKMTGGQLTNPIPAATQAAVDLDNSIVPGAAAVAGGLGVAGVGAGVHHVRKHTSSEGTVSGFRDSLRAELTGGDKKPNTDTKKPAPATAGAGKEPDLDVGNYSPGRAAAERANAAANAEAAAAAAAEARKQRVYAHAAGSSSKEDVSLLLQRLRAEGGMGAAGGSESLALKLMNALEASNKLPDAKSMYDPSQLPWIGKRFQNKIPLSKIRNAGLLGLAGVGTAYGSQALGDMFAN